MLALTRSVMDLAVCMELNKLYMAVIVIRRTYMGYLTSGGRRRTSSYTATVKHQCRRSSCCVDAS